MTVFKQPLFRQNIIDTNIDIPYIADTSNDACGQIGKVEL
jgi:hypothetical protein